ncbi:MAG: aminopeptidase P N-terminal domain-containing protein [Acholeplasmatales bacterium]|nr:aminopeptidase P N-terminal domain-containing protein [Acholeplasmatales bacterium]
MNYFKKRRDNLFGLMLENSILISFSRYLNKEPIYNDRYDVLRNTYYITGVIDYGHIVVLIKDKENKEILFIDKDNSNSKFEGEYMSKEEYHNISLIDDIRDKKDFKIFLDESVKKYQFLYLDIDDIDLKTGLGMDNILAKKIKASNPNIRIKTSESLFKRLRCKKDEYEINNLKEAISITNKGIESILSHIGPMYEYQLESYFDQAVKYNGASSLSFPSIFASGKNSIILHYDKNDTLMKDGDLLLVDLGATKNMYSADISRTFPVSGKFSKRELLFYNIVLEGQKRVFDAMKPGVTLKQLDETLVDFYFNKLKEIGLVKAKEDVSKYYYHSVSHHIGLNCHDIAFDDEPLEEGAVISNEPGLYIEEENIGIRIEDDILITKDGAINLSEEIIKDPYEIERYIKEHR